MKRIVVLSLLVATAGLSNATTILANSTAPGDSYTNPGTSNQGQAVGLTSWFYNNVRNSGVVGINNTYARSGNGSAYLETTVGPGGNSSKADIEFLAGGTSLFGNFVATSSLGTLGQLTSLSYDWYRDNVSTNSNAQHPALRILIDADGNLLTTGDRGGLVFERAYNSLTVPTDTWVTDAVSGSTNLWSYGFGVSFAFGGYNRTLNDWITGFTDNNTASPLSADSKILGFSAGVGSGWGPFKGAVDNISWTIDGNSSSYNFEVAGEPAVPGPAAALPMALGFLVGLARRRRK